MYQVMLNDADWSLVLLQQLAVSGWQWKLTDSSSSDSEMLKDISGRSRRGFTTHASLLSSSSTSYTITIRCEWEDFTYAITSLPINQWRSEGAAFRRGRKNGSYNGKNGVIRDQASDDFGGGKIAVLLGFCSFELLGIIFLCD